MSTSITTPPSVPTLPITAAHTTLPEGAISITHLASIIALHTPNIFAQV